MPTTVILGISQQVNKLLFINNRWDQSLIVELYQEGCAGRAVHYCRLATAPKHTEPPAIRSSAPVTSDSIVYLGCFPSSRTMKIKSEKMTPIRLNDNNVGVVPGYWLDDFWGCVLDVGQEALSSSTQDVQESAACLIRVVHPCGRGLSDMVPLRQWGGAAEDGFRAWRHWKVHARLASFLMKALLEYGPMAPRSLDGMSRAARPGERASCQGAQMARCTEILLIGRKQARCVCITHYHAYAKVTRVALCNRWTAINVIKNNPNLDFPHKWIIPPVWTNRLRRQNK